MRRLFVPLAMVVSGCGGSWSDADLEFIRSLPTRQDLSLSPPSDASRKQLSSGDVGTRTDHVLEQSGVYRGVLEAIDGVNSSVAVLTYGLDYIRTVPPNQRDKDWRLWGPYPDDKHPGIETEVIIERTLTTGAPVYGYRFNQRRKNVTDFGTVIGGTFRGDCATGGSGEVHFDAGVARDLGTLDPKDQNLASIDLKYDMTGSDVKAGLYGRGLDGALLAFAYVVVPDGAGEIGYGVRANLEGTPTSAQEELGIRARWLADKSGRLDLVVKAGDLGAGTGAYAECWNTTFMQVYKGFAYNCGGTGCAACGGLQACAGAEGREVDCSIR